MKKKYLNDENHAEYEAQKISTMKIKENIKKHLVPYDHSAKKNSLKRFNVTKLIKINKNKLPCYIKKNFSKYKNWIID